MLEVIAEGIETQDQASTLITYGCGEAKGYLYGKPMPAEAFELASMVTARAVA